MVIAGAEDEEYKLTINDIDTSLVFMYTPVTEEGTKGEPHYKYTDFVKSGTQVLQILCRSCLKFFHYDYICHA